MKTSYLNFTIILFLINISTIRLLYSQKFNPHQLAIKGYLRTGIGTTNGGQMVSFVTPENVHKFRMGNEADHYGELEFNYQYHNKDSVKVFEVNYMMAEYVAFGAKPFKKFPPTAQLNVKVNRVVKTANIWLGKRYYDRRNVEMLDYFWLNAGQNSQIGIGLENYEINNAGSLNFALIRFKYDNKNLHTYTADLRYLAIPLTKFSKINFLGQYSKETDNNTAEHTGYALGSWITYANKNISHTTTILYRSGSAITESAYSGKTVLEFKDGKRLYDHNKASSLDVINNFVYDDKRNYAIQASLTYQYKNYGFSETDQFGIPLHKESSKNWLSLGFRNMYYITKNLNLAIEAGNDYMKSDGICKQGSLQKLTFSPQISWDYGYYNRPVLRPFVTYAHWSNNFTGSTGLSDYNARLLNKHQGLSLGLQVEYWW